MSHIRFRRAASFLVLAAMAYSLGARDCGCWEHSGWRAALASLSGVEMPREATGGWAFDEHECEHERETLATLGPRCSLKPAVGGITPAVSSIVLDGMADPTWLSGTLPETAAAEAKLSALPVCALLQVFRL